MGTESKVIKSSDYRWNAVPEKEYKDEPDSHEGVSRYTLLGAEGEEQPLNFQTRYFEIKPGGYTSFEHHRHPHSVVVIRGSGSVILDDKLEEISSHDVVYVAPGTMHQFHADQGVPLGFLCIVDRKRDKPVVPGNEEVDDLIRSKEVRGKVRR